MNVAWSGLDEWSRLYVLIQAMFIPVSRGGETPMINMLYTHRNTMHPIPKFGRYKGHVFTSFILTVITISTYKLLTRAPPLHVDTLDLVLQKLDPHEYPEALCMDGSPVAFYHNIVDGLENKDVIIYLPGGGRCFSTDQCYERLDYSLCW